MPVTIEISGSNYIKCCNYSENNWGSSKPGYYGKGLGNKVDDPHMIERISKLSEVVVSNYFNVESPDFEYRRGGDRGSDLEIAGLKVDVKCATRDYGANVFKGLANNGRTTLKSDLYIFCYVEQEDRIAHTAQITIVGYMSKREILGFKLVPPRKKFTTRNINYDIRHRLMVPIEGLKHELGIE